MPRKKPNERSEGARGGDIPSQEDEADIVEEIEEIGAERDENGALVVDEKTVRDVGAIDPESVRANRRSRAFADKKRGNVPGVMFGSDDVLERYEAAIKVWPPNTLDITLTRRTGTPVQHVIRSRPRSGSELYDAIKAIHGQHEEAEYEIRCIDANSRQYRLSGGRIVMPDTRPPQQGQPMTYPYPPPPGYPPQMPQPAPSYPGAQQAAPQPPVVVQAPPPPDMGTAFATFQQAFEMFRSMQQQMNPQGQPAAPPPFMPPPPPANPDMQSMMAWMRQMFEMVQSMQPPQQPQAPAPRGAAAQPQAPQVPNPMMLAMMGAPPTTPPPGTIWVPGFGFVPLDRLMQAVGAAPPSPSPGPAPYRPPYRPPYYPHRDPNGAPPYDPPGPSGAPPYVPSAPPRERTAAENFREAITFVRSAAEAAQEFNSLFQTPPAQHHEAAVQVGEDDEDNPIRVVDAGAAKFAINKHDGTLRKLETGLMNLPDIMKWLGEQREAMQKSAAERRQQQLSPQQQTQLPPGYVEVSPGYQPPPGFVAVPVDQIPGGLPPPPTHVPPPIGSAARAWGAPPIPPNQDES